MIQEQEAEKSKFLQEQAKIDAQTKIIRAQAEAKSAEILGKAVSDNPKIIQMEMIKKWDGKMPQIIDGNNGLIMSLK
jgi:prohibitin 2